MEQGSHNPFLDDIFVKRPDALPGIAHLHEKIFLRVVESVERMSASPAGGAADFPGRTILITAPRAGYGKTHLNARLKERLRPLSTVLTLPLEPSRPIAWPVALSSILRQFNHESGSRTETKHLFEETARFFLGRLLLSHLANGNVDPEECPMDEETLRNESARIFSSPGSASLLGWMDQRSRELCQDADPEFLRTLGLTASELTFWTRLILDFHLRGEAALDPLRGLSNGEARERLLQWLRLATFHRPVLLIVDGLDGFYRSESAGMEIADLLTGIRESVPRSLAIVSVNEDVWHSVFSERLPSAWLDRISGESEQLGPMTSEAAGELVRARLERSGLSRSVAERFVEQLSEVRRWESEDTALSPRNVIRWARELWKEDAETYLTAAGSAAPQPSPDIPAGCGEDRESRERKVASAIDAAKPEEEEQRSIQEVEQNPLPKPTDKVGFFASLVEDHRAKSPSSKPGDANSEDTAATDKSKEAANGGSVTPPPLPATSRPNLLNPFFAPPDQPTPSEEEHSELLAGIESIIADIRGSGKTVATGSVPALQKQSTAPTLFRTGDSAPEAPLTAGLLKLSIPDKTVRSEKVDSPAKKEPVKSFAEKLAAPILSPPPELPSSLSIRDQLKAAEKEISAERGLKLDLMRVEEFIQKVGSKHPGLGQTVERFPGSRTVCARWRVRGRSVVIGFESPGNVYFWSNLLQQSLASNRLEKIAAFSHPSVRFDPALFSSFGFSPAVIRGRIDIIETGDRELAMIYAADSILSRYFQKPEEEAAIQSITMYLDPLWRRISRPLS